MEPPTHFHASTRRTRVPHTEVVQDCTECGGWGRYTCSDCAGAGSKQCHKCDGEKGAWCDMCDGQGWKWCGQCEGAGARRCPRCEGAGRKSCTSCRASGRVPCHECGGSGTGGGKGGGKGKGDDTAASEMESRRCDKCRGEGWLECSVCKGEKEVYCDACKEGVAECDACKGEKWSQCSKCKGEKWLECAHCKGGGRLQCERCKGDGKVTCTSCKGHCKMRMFQELETKWFNKCDEKLLNQGTSHLSSEEIRAASGRRWEVQGLPLQPTSQYCDAVNAATAMLCQTAVNHCQGSQLHMQKMMVTEVPVCVVTATYKDSDFTFTVYGKQHLVSAEDYPAKNCGCCGSCVLS